MPTFRVHQSALIAVAATIVAGCATRPTASPGIMRPSTNDERNSYALHETAPTAPPTMEYLGQQRYSSEVNAIMDQSWPVTKLTMAKDGSLLSFTLVGTDPAIPSDGPIHYWSSIIFGNNGRIVQAVPASMDWAGCTLQTYTDNSTNPPTITYGCVKSTTEPCPPTKYCKTTRTLIGNDWVWKCDCEPVPAEN